MMAAAVEKVLMMNDCGEGLFEVVRLIGCDDVCDF